MAGPYRRTCCWIIPRRRLRPQLPRKPRSSNCGCNDARAGSTPALRLLSRWPPRCGEAADAFAADSNKNPRLFQFQHTHGTAFHLLTIPGYSHPPPRPRRRTKLKQVFGCNQLPFVVRAPFLRRLYAESSTRCTLCTSRSRMESAQVGSPITS
jgi:hypothetical protein